MRIGHIAIWSNDIERLNDFYVKYFGGTANKKYINEKKKFQSYFVSFVGGARMEIMTCNSLKDKVDTDKQIGLAHIAFSIGSKESVDKLTKLLKKDGYAIVGQPRTTGDGYYESVIKDPDGNAVEITE